jgi:hypothetical protein
MAVNPRFLLAGSSGYRGEHVDLKKKKREEHIDKFAERRFIMFIFQAKYCYNNKIDKNKMGEAYSRNGKIF